MGKIRLKEIWKKIKTVVLEITIVFIGVLLAAFIADYRTKSLEKKEAKDFLISLSEQIYQDVQEIDFLIENFKNYDSLYTYLSTIDTTQGFEQLQFDSAIYFTQGNAWLLPNISLYEGFKSSGKLSNIPNKELMFKTLYFYQEGLPQLKASENWWLQVHQRLREYIFNNLEFDSSGKDNSLDLILSSKGKILTQALIPHQQIFERYENLQNLGKEIVLDIDKEYKLKKTYNW